MVLLLKVLPAKVEDIFIPTIAELDPEPVCAEELLRFLIVFPIIVGIPVETTMPTAWEDEVPVELLLRLAIVLPLTLTVAGPEVTVIPVTEPVPVPALERFILLARVVLPIVLLLMVRFVVTPPLEPIPIRLVRTVAEPTTLIPPILLFLQSSVVLVPPTSRMPHETPELEVVLVRVIVPLVVLDPIVFPEIVPIFTLPFTTLIPANIGLTVLVVLKAIFLIVLF